MMMASAHVIALDRNPYQSRAFRGLSYKGAKEERVPDSCAGCRIKLLGFDHICKAMIDGRVCRPDRAERAAGLTGAFAGRR